MKASYFSTQLWILQLWTAALTVSQFATPLALYLYWALCIAIVLDLVTYSAMCLFIGSSMHVVDSSLVLRGIRDRYGDPMVNPRHWQSPFRRPCCFYLSGSALFRPARSLSLVFKNDVMLSYPWENSHYSRLLVLPLAKHVLECPYPEIETWRS